MRTTTSLLLAMAALATSSAQASTVSLPPGTVRDITLSRPITLTVRLSNTGDCTIGLVGKDTNGHEILNGLIRPGEVQDVETLSAKLASVTAIVQRDGTTGAILQSAPLSNGQEVRVPPGTGFLSCNNPPGHVMFRAGDGEATRPVTYQFRYGSLCSNGTIQINVFNRAGQPAGGGQINPITPTLTITRDDVLRIEVISTQSGPTPSMSFFYTRNP